MITTKRGKEGKARISFTTSASILAPTKLVEQANSYEYATFYNAMNRNDGASPVFSDAVIQKFQDGTDPIRFPSIKWTDYIMGDATLQSQHNVNISGGTDKVDLPERMSMTMEQRQKMTRSNLVMEMSIF